MQALNIIIDIVLCAFSIFLIAVILLQSGRKTGVSGAITGGAEMIVGKQKARSMDAKLNKLTKIVAVAFMIIAVALVIINRFVA